MKISDLIKALEKRKNLFGDVEVFITWEGTEHALEEDEIYLTKDRTLYLDADSNFYKPVFMIDMDKQCCLLSL